MSKSNIAVAFNVKLSSVHAILKVYQKEERVEKNLRAVLGKGPFVPIKKVLLKKKFLIILNLHLQL